MQFTSLGAFALHLLSLEAREQRSLEKGLKDVAKHLEAAAKSQFGSYQGAAGPFQAWPALADSTKQSRVEQGYPADEPLLRDGKLRASISHSVQGLEAAVGSTSDVMVWQELGTSRIPPRPVLGPVAIRNKTVIEKAVGVYAVKGLLPVGYIGAPNAPTDKDYRHEA